MKLVELSSNWSRQPLLRKTDSRLCKHVPTTVRAFVIFLFSCALYTCKKLSIAERFRRGREMDNRAFVNLVVILWENNEELEWKNITVKIKPKLKFNTKEKSKWELRAEIEVGNNVGLEDKVPSFLLHLDPPPDYDVEVDFLESSDGAKYFIPKVDDDIKPKINDKFTSVKEAESMYRRLVQLELTDIKPCLTVALSNVVQHARNIVPEYFFEYKCNGRELNAIFWADEFARLNYKEFGDVISFDGTFRTNLHCMIFVPFIAVDNHKSSVVVGSALINGETIDNFTWVLQAFLSCHGKQPVFVITDQCAAVRQAIPLVFPESKHRLCMWHIMDKVPSKVSIALKYNTEFNRVINKLVERNYSENTVECQCRFFVRNGYLCWHALDVLINDKVCYFFNPYVYNS
ncbi:hypothetical protein L6452_19359 [Arctium lappa]|uniref:Uncharacterized protein n=1 Tax=Arctium lappa TaxID=4217 RepID=A0ACB9B959_ARCLA|nr:hypothetical protein L6452_19359 [Arctium lappa]